MTSQRGPAGEGPPSQTPVTVSISTDADLEQVTAALRRTGLEISEIFEPLGTLAGRVPADRLAALRAVPGVEAVEPERRYQLPPPNSDIQ
ncbi:hypothetical protein [Frankia sp. Cj3]|uniref:hypothetical protein n=1 Tax=Frankia sp. Cj3 TaxID=2880976 RepID=UPI001EF6ED04|nr:hypothetical protein [Frankia sp. Cj3]